MPIILTTDTSASSQISNLVSVAYDSKNLTHAQIIQDVFLGDANLRIQAAIPLWEDLTGENLTRLRIIVMKLCAINILAAFARVRRQQIEVLSEDNDQLTPSQAIKRYEDDISTGVELLNPSSTGIDGRYITAAVVV